jgi:hypothetical protein
VTIYTYEPSTDSYVSVETPSPDTTYFYYEPSTQAYEYYEPSPVSAPIYTYNEYTEVYEPVSSTQSTFYPYETYFYSSESSADETYSYTYTSTYVPEAEYMIFQPQAVVWNTYFSAPTVPLFAYDTNTEAYISVETPSPYSSYYYFEPSTETYEVYEPTTV